MAKIALGIALVLMLATAFFGFQTKGKIEALNQDLKGAQENLSTRDQAVSKAQSDLKAVQEEALAAAQKADAATGDITSAADRAARAETQARELSTKLAEVGRELEEATRRAQSAARTGEDPASAQASSEQLQKLQSDLKDAQTKVAELTATNQRLSSEIQETETARSKLRDTQARQERRTMSPGITGTVLAVNSNYGFVVLNLGNRQGAVAGSELILMRGSDRIGKVKITTVEPATSVADIIPGSLARGVQIRPGDRVIFAGGS